MADAPWQPRLRRHRAELAALVALYGPVTHPPTGQGETWDGRDVWTSRDGRRRRCMWCGSVSGYDHHAGCPASRALRLAELERAIPAAEVAAQAAADRLAALIAERDALGGGP